MGDAAANTLSLCAQYLDLLSRMHGINQMLQQHQDLQQQQQQGQQQQEQDQQQQQPLQLPAGDVTAAVLHTASLLLTDLGKHIANKTTPPTVSCLLAKPERLQQVAFVVATLFGSQLQLKLLHLLQEQDHLEQAQGSSGSGNATGDSGGGSSSSDSRGNRSGGSHTCSSNVGGSGGSSDGNSSGGAGPPATAAERAEGVLLCCVQHYIQPQAPPALPPSISVLVVQSWLQHFEASWGELLPAHLLLPIATAIEAAGGASAPRVEGLCASRVTFGSAAQAYLLLLPEDCLEKAPAVAGSTSAAVRSLGGNTGRDSSSSSGCQAGTQLCCACVAAASRVLGLHRQPVCQVARHCMERAPLLLLASAVAALCVEGSAALPAACACCQAADTWVAFLWCQGTEDKSCAVCADLLAPLAWPTVG
jgi:hypothetical protein